MKLEKPRGTTHVRYNLPNKKKGILDVKDLDCLQGVVCKITWLKGSTGKINLLFKKDTTTFESLSPISDYDVPR